MKISVLIANYNNGAFFKACFESLIVQNWKDWEAIIVDDCSTDNSIELMEQLISGDQRFKIFRNNRNQGCGFTKRRCVDLANGELCGFVDPDDALIPDALEKMVTAHVGGDYAVVHSKLFYCDAELRVQKPYREAKTVDTTDPYFFNLGGPVSHFVTFKRAAYQLTEGIDAYMKRAVDQDLYIKLAEVGRFHFIDEPLYLYRIHEGGISTNINIDNAYFWHWFAILQAGKRRGLDLEQEFGDAFVPKWKYDWLKNNEEKSRAIKIARKMQKLVGYFRK